MPKKRNPTDYYLGTIDGTRMVVCRRHVPMLQSKPEFVGGGLRCHVCEELKSTALKKLHNRNLFITEPSP